MQFCLSGSLHSLVLLHSVTSTAPLSLAELKHDHIKLENQGTGCVLVTDFYGAAAAGAWQLSESVNYLQITLMHHQNVWHHQTFTQSAALMNVRRCIKKMVAETAVIYPPHIYIYTITT